MSKTTHPAPKDIFVAIFNYNKNENALRLKSIFLPHFKTYIFDSGSEPPCPDAIHFGNIYYGGMFNEAIKKSSEYKWCCIITSDVLIDDQNAKGLIERMRQISVSQTTGNYQPSCDRRGRSHSYGYNHRTGNFRSVPYMEGWFQMFRTSLKFSVPLEINRNGWGTDLYLCKCALAAGLNNIVDDAVTVYHPKDSGLDFQESKAQMAAWALTLPDWENKIKIGMGIIAYEGTEHLETIIREVRSAIDVVAILFSETSYGGYPASDAARNEVYRLREIGLVDDIILFPHIPRLPPREQETVRRNQGMAYFQSKGCDYALISDSDEFYTREQFDKAKDGIRTSLPEASFCYYRNYYKFKNCELLDDFYEKMRLVPFLCRTSSRFQYDIPFLNPSDPTRRIASEDAMLFTKEALTMNHWSWIRDDIRPKISNWSANEHFTDKERDEMIDYYAKFDVRQTYVRIPHKIKGNKIEVKFVE